MKLLVDIEKYLIIGGVLAAVGSCVITRDFSFAYVGLAFLVPAAIVGTIYELCLRKQRKDAS